MHYSPAIAKVAAYSGWTCNVARHGHDHQGAGYVRAALSVASPAPLQRIDTLLVARGFFESRARAQAAIAAGLVQVAGKVVGKPSLLVAGDADIVASAPHPFVSRGGVKLAAALDHFGYAVAGRICLDIGASTGGFCDVLAQRGAAKIYAVDVGHGQLHPRLQANPVIVSMEGCDARDLVPADFSAPPQLVTFDASFISLRLLLGPVLAQAAPQAQCIALIKPQFEAGRAAVHKGIVRDAAARAKACRDVEQMFEQLGWKVAGVIASPIAGGDGNQEFLIGAAR